MQVANSLECNCRELLQDTVGFQSGPLNTPMLDSNHQASSSLCGKCFAEIDKEELRERYSQQNYRSSCQNTPNQPATDDNAQHHQFLFERNSTDLNKSERGHQTDRDLMADSFHFFPSSVNPNRSSLYGTRQTHVNYQRPSARIEENSSTFYNCPTPHVMPTAWSPLYYIESCRSQSAQLLPLVIPSQNGQLFQLQLCGHDIAEINGSGSEHDCKGFYSKNKSQKQSRSHKVKIEQRNMCDDLTSCSCRSATSRKPRNFVDKNDRIPTTNTKCKNDLSAPFNIVDSHKWRSRNKEQKLKKNPQNVYDKNSMKDSNRFENHLNTLSTNPNMNRVVNRTPVLNNSIVSCSNLYAKEKVLSCKERKDKKNNEPDVYLNNKTNRKTQNFCEKR